MQLPNVSGWKRRLDKSLRRHGVIGMLRHAGARARHLVEVLAHTRRDHRELGRDASFDQQFGVDTAGTISLSDLEIRSDNWIYGLCYVATATHLLEEVLSQLPVRHEEFLFVDLGSGKGRALLLASHFPFKGILGVEFSPALHSAAVQNIGRYRNPARRCREVTSICQDAAHFEPPDAPAVFYLYRPFEDVVLATFLARLGASLARHPRAVFVAYVNPPPHSILDRTDFLEPVLRDLQQEYVIYQARPSAPGGGAATRAEPPH